MSSFADSAEPPIAGNPGVRAPPLAGDADPYHALDDLMAAVEALCPVWPPRAGFRAEARLLL